MSGGHLAKHYYSKDTSSEGKWENNYEGNAGEIEDGSVAGGSATNMHSGNSYRIETYRIEGAVKVLGDGTYGEDKAGWDRSFVTNEQEDSKLVE